MSNSKTIRTNNLFVEASNSYAPSDALSEEARQMIQNTPANIDTAPWADKTFSHPERTIRLATSFSGIGAIEHAFARLGLKHEIVFAGDIEAKCKQSYFANYIAGCAFGRVLHLRLFECIVLSYSYGS